MKIAGKWLLQGGLFLVLMGTSFTSETLAQGVLNIVATSNPSTPPAIGATVGTQVNATLSATVTNPPMGSYTCPIQGPNWSWQIGSVQLNGAAPPNGSYSLSLNQPISSSSNANLSCTFYQAGNWTVPATATASYSDTCSNTWTGQGTVTVSFAVIAVSISTDGLYVGCGLDQTPIHLTANPTPADLVGVSYQWYASSNPGYGTFGTPSQPNTTFVGSMEGPAVLGVMMSYQMVSTTATQPVTVVRIDTLTQNVTPQIMIGVTQLMGFVQ